MRKALILLSIILVSSLLSAKNLVIENPNYDYSKFFIFNKITIKPTETEVEVTIRHRPNYWVMVESNSFLKESDGNSTFRLLRSEGYELDKRKQYQGRTHLSRYRSMELYAVKIQILRNSAHCIS